MEEPARGPLCRRKLYIYEGVCAARSRGCPVRACDRGAFITPVIKKKRREKEEEIGVRDSCLTRFHERGEEASNRNRRGGRALLFFFFSSRADEASLHASEYQSLCPRSRTKRPSDFTCAITYSGLLRDGDSLLESRASVVSFACLLQRLIAFREFRYLRRNVDESTKAFDSISAIKSTSRAMCTFRLRQLIPRIGESQVLRKQNSQ